MRSEQLAWQGIQALPSRSYKCGHCGSSLASQNGYRADYGSAHAATIYVCHFCHRPTFFDLDGTPTPGNAFGNPVQHIPDASINSLYEEARKATSAGSYTAAVLCCRKLLMHIAVAKGAQPGEPFISYVEYLANKNYVPPDARDWVDHIRAKGNEANHEIVIMPKEDAEELLSFIEMLLKVIFEFPATVKQKTRPS